MQSFASPFSLWLFLRLPVTGVSAALLCLFLGACSQPDSPPSGRLASTTHAAYVVHFGVSRLKDHSSLASVNVPLRLGQTGAVRTGSKLATEEKPALPEFAATLTGTKIPGLYQLVTKMAIREAARNKKGKLKVSKRNQGTLLPVRLGEKQAASPADDPIQVDVQVDRR